MSDEDKQNFALQDIEKHLRRNGTSLERFTSMPKPQATNSNDSNVLIVDERSYPRQDLLETLDKDLPKMTDEQRKIYDEILHAVTKGTGGRFLSMDLVVLVKLSSGNYFPLEITFGSYQK